MSEGGMQVGGDAGQAQQGEAQGFDAAQAFGELKGSQAEMQQLLAGMQEQFQAAPWAQQEQQGEGEGQQEQQADVDLSFLDDPSVDPVQALQQFRESIKQELRQEIRQEITPVRDGLTEERYHREAADLVAEFPELGMPEMQDKLFNQQTGAAVQLAQQMGDPSLAQKPAFWRAAYLSLKGMEAAQAEQEAGADASGAAHLEGSGGANPGGGQVDLADLIVGGEGRRYGGGVLG